MSRGERMSQGAGDVITQTEAGVGGERDPHALHTALGTREPRGAVSGFSPWSTQRPGPED